MKNTSIAVVGGGSVGTSFVRQLADRLKASDRIPLSHLYIYEPSPDPGAGAAYQPDTASNLLNTRVGTMSPIANDAAHFHRWLMANRELWSPLFPGLDLTANSFVPRALFGMYLNKVFTEAVDLLKGLGVAVYHLPHKVSSVTKLRDGYEVCTVHGVSRMVSGVILCLGNLETTEWDHMRTYERYFNTPYPCTELIKGIDSKASVCILGSSLSAIDAAVSLADAGHTGKIMMVSRNGRLPSVRGEQNLARTTTLLSRSKLEDLTLRRAGQVSLKEIAELLMKELELCEGEIPNLQNIMRIGQGPHKYLDSEIGDAAVRDRAWQAIAYSTNESIDLIWRALSLDQKRLFQREYKSLWHSYRVSFPIENAIKLQQLLHTDQLSVYAGFKDVFYDEATSRFAVNIQNKNTGFEATVLSDAVVNATGYSTSVEKMRSPLLKGMLSRGLVCADEFGGIKLEFESGRVIARSGLAMRGLFALGSLASGTYFWTNAMNVNTRLAAGMVQRVLDDISLDDVTVDQLADYSQTQIIR